MTDIIHLLASHPLTLILMGIVAICVFFFIRECWKNIKSSR